MNFLTFVFSLLLLLSLGTFTLLEQQAGNHRIRSTFLGHLKANRKILSHIESATYKTFRAVPNPNPHPKEKNDQEKDSQPKTPLINPSCARLNLWPLIAEGKEEHPFLYELAAKLLKTLYGPFLFENKPRFEYRFLDLLLKRAKETFQKQGNQFPLEKLSLNDPSLQLIYYQMLKGTKERGHKELIGYPSLLDSISLEESKAKVCLCHAHPEQIGALLGAKTAARLFQELHREERPPLTKEWIETICSECHARLDPEIFAHLEIGRFNHDPKGKEVFIAEDSDTHISLRKNVYLPRA